MVNNVSKVLSAMQYIRGQKLVKILSQLCAEYRYENIDLLFFFEAITAV